ncbi:MAG: DUF6582 domain-containing protein [Coriobacteriia bacterium]|nr:DUF6582 domain-containing protein [Coriobacteriia bacterium]
MTPETTWRPYPTHGKPAAAALPETAFAFSARRELPLTDEGSVRSAIEAFAEVEGVTDDDREQAFANIRRAAAFYRVPMDETDWRQLGGQPVERPYERESWDGKR